MTDTKYLLSVKDLAQMLGISVSTVWRRCDDRTLPAPIRLGGTTRWVRAEVLSAVEAVMAKRPAPAK